MTYGEWLDWFNTEYGRAPSMRERYDWMRENNVGMPWGGRGGASGRHGGGMGGGRRSSSSSGNGGTTPTPEPTPEPAPEPESTMSPELEEILEEFRNALATFITNPGFITGEGGVGGWSGPVAEWMRGNQDYLSNMFTEMYMKQATADPSGQLPEYTPTDWLSRFNPESAYRMTPPSGYTVPPGWRAPVTTVRRLRI